jgi:CPA2 family monovalent cation:H+ antiporter-2
MVRADSAEAVRALYALGVQEVTSPEFEAAIEMTRQALMYFNVPAHDVLRVASAIRRERYDAPGSAAAHALSPTGEIARQLELAWLRVPAESRFEARTIAELAIRTSVGASVVGIVRAGALVANPESSEHFERGDLVAVLGTREQIVRFEEAMRAEAPVRS